MKERISVRPVYFYTEEKELIDALDSSYVNFQKLIKSLLWNWLEIQKELKK